ASHAPPSDSTVTVTRLARVSRLGTTSSSSPRFWICTTRRFVTEGLSPLRLMTLGTLSLTTAMSSDLWQMFVAPVQTPPWHASSAVHGSPSWHDVPFVFAGFEQAPVEGLHDPAAWQSSLAVHTTGSAPAQTPATHASCCVHALPSLQAALLFV